MVEITEDMDLLDMMISGGGRDGPLMSPETPEKSRFVRNSNEEITSSSSHSSTVDELIEDDIRNAQAALSRTIVSRGGIQNSELLYFFYLQNIYVTNNCSTNTTFFCFFPQL